MPGLLTCNVLVKIHLGVSCERIVVVFSILIFKPDLSLS